MGHFETFILTEQTLNALYRENSHLRDSDVVLATI